MKNWISKLQLMVLALLLALVVMPFTANALTIERYENTDISVTSKLPPQWLGWKVHVGSTTQNIAVYYKIAAVVTGMGETVAGPVTTAYTTYAPVSSTNSLRMMWAPVQGATSYKLYKSVDNSTFNLLATITAPTLTYVDDGDAVGAAYSAPSPPGGNLTVENDISVGGDVTIAGDLTVSGTLNPYSTGTFTGESIELTYGLSAASAAFTAEVTAADLAATDDMTVGDDLAVTGLATVGETLTVTGNTMLGAANYKSTMTASNGNWAITGNVVSAAAVQGATVTGTTSVTSPLYIGTGPIRFYSRTKAQVCAIDPTAAGEAYYASDLKALMVSTGTAVNDYAQVDDPTKGCE